ncbi:MAG: DsbA family protein [Candidatus Niyogibacteria bacterium]|nr:DsbA family protein [Candidatus Niyogibacteria bacterium]
MENNMLTKKESRMIKRQEKLDMREASARRKHVNRYALWGGMLAVLALFIFGVAKLAIYTGTHQTASLAVAVGGEDIFKGGADAKAVLVEYSDFQCPACARYAPMVKAAAEEFGSNIKVVYRHFPLNSIHKNADLAARAAESAGLQGKFWEMHDLIFENQSAWAESGSAEGIFTELAHGLGLNADKFKEDLASSRVKSAVNDDLRSGELSSVAGTPTFFLNGKIIPNPRSLDEFKKIISAELGK